MLEWCEFGRGPRQLPTADRCCEFHGPERRRVRSENPLRAMRLLLESARQAGGLQTLVVADETGCLVAGAGAFDDCEQLAAMAPLISAQQTAANDTVPTRLDVLARRHEVRRVTVDGLRVLICGQGGASQLHAIVEQAAAGCDRILGRRRPHA